MEKRIFSGIQPTGNLHIGNYIGAVSQWVKNQEEGLNIYCVVDLHAITIPQDPDILREKSLDTAALLIALGIDPTKSILFIQSQNPDHTYLSWILNCFISMGQLNRMTQYKDKSEGKEFVSVGLFDYPALMASDILLYDTTEVPIGEDQKQHVELARDVAERFNAKYGDVFTLPEPVIPKTGARIMSLNDPSKKMSKSDENPDARINLLDDKDTIYAKIARATTDSGNEVEFDPKEKPGISNLLVIYSQVTGIEIAKAEEKFKGVSYRDFKNALSEEVVKFLSPIQEKYRSLKEDKGRLEEVLEKGAEKAREISGRKLNNIKEKIGLY